LILTFPDGLFLSTMPAYLWLSIGEGMAQGRADSATSNIANSLVDHPLTVADAGSRSPLPVDWEHPRIAAVVTVVTDEDYRCVWRPCPELEDSEDERNGERNAELSADRKGEHVE
jgi:hypothetical protein